MFDFIRDENGKLSSTRIILLVALSLFTILVSTDIFFEVYYDSQILEIIEAIFMFGLGGQAVRTTVHNWREDMRVAKAGQNSIE